MGRRVVLAGPGEQYPGVRLMLGGHGRTARDVVPPGVVCEGRKVVGERGGLSRAARQQEIVDGLQDRALPLGGGGGQCRRGQHVVGRGGPGSRRGLLTGQRGNLGRQPRVRAAGRCHPMAQGDELAANEPGGAGVQAGPPGRADIVVHSSMDEWVGKRDQPIDGGGMVLEQLSGGGLLEGFQRVGDLGQAGGQRQGAAGAEHGGGGDQALSVWRAAGQLSLYQRAERPGSRQGPRAMVQDARGKFLQQGPGVQRVAAGVLVQSFGGSQWQHARAERRAERAQLVDAQTAQSQPRRRRSCHEPAQAGRQLIRADITGRQQRQYPAGPKAA